MPPRQPHSCPFAAPRLDPSEPAQTPPVGAGTSVLTAFAPPPNAAQEDRRPRVRVVASGVGPWAAD
ncbi:Protein of unknown function [Gryllus bimaculatus]|nr:Protein of unknown function [Gryllus bimaculatus]